MASTGSQIDREELATYGYLRDVLDNDQDFVDIITVILKYYQQGFAKYFDAEIDENCKEKMKFGDIVRVEYDFLALNMDNEVVDAGADSGDIYDTPGEDLDVIIPVSICKHLTDAMSFYSKLSEYDFFKNADNFNFAAEVKKDDNWIINNLKGALKRQYPKIKIKFRNGKFDGLFVLFGLGCYRDFDTINENITHKDIDKFYEIRTDKNNLVKMDVRWNPDQINGEIAGYKPLPLLWNYRLHYEGDEPDQMVCLDYIGPKTDVETLNKIREYYTSMGYDITVTIVDVEDTDTLKKIQ